MDKLYMARQQGDAAVGVAAASTILQVALDHSADGCQLATYLMVAARKEVDLDKVVTVAMREYLVPEYGFLGILYLMVVGIALVLLLVAHEPMDERTLLQPFIHREGLGGRPLHNSPVGLMHLTIGKHLVESGQRLTGPCKNN